MKEVVLKLVGEENFFVQEAYKTLRTNLQFCGQDVKVILFTSVQENEGKSTVSLQTAKSLVELGKKVLLIDADLRKSVLAGRNSDAKNPVGLSEVLSGMSSVGECLYESQYEGLHILFSGQTPPNPVELLGSKYFAKLIAEAREVYDYIIVDTPPLGMVIDAAVIAPICDGTALVVGNDARASDARNVVSQLEKTGCKVLGAVRNNVRTKHRSAYNK